MMLRGMWRRSPNWQPSPYALAVLIMGVAAGSALAHVPLPEGDYTDPESALFVAYPDISQVIYYELSPERPALWLAFDGEQPIWLQLGVPMISGLADFQPLLCLVGPGLPAAEKELPFTVPDSKGVQILAPDPAAERGEFYEHFTGTPSWVFGGWDVDLPDEGRYYVVAAPAGDHYGKLWVAVGRREVFSLADILDLPQTMRDVRAFHEVEPPLPTWFRITAQATLVSLFWLAVVLLR